MTTDQYLGQFRRDGFALFDRVIPAHEVDAVRASVLDAANRAYDPQIKAELGVTNVRSSINHDQSFAPYVADDRLMDVLHELFGPHVRISFSSTQINDPGNPRSGWHADWPFNQRNAGHIPAPYPDFCIHVTTLWMLSPFTKENGGTLIVPGSHRMNTNPTVDMGIDPDRPYPTEMLVTGEAGTVIMFDSRLWHAANYNGTTEPRVSMAIRYAPWWLNLDVLRPDSDERKRMVDEAGAKENLVPLVARDVFDHLPEHVKPLWRHWVEPVSPDNALAAGR